MNNKHLTFDDRLTIQAGLQQGLKVAQIAKNIGKDRSTVGCEIKAHRKLVATSKGNSCVYHSTCKKVPECRQGCIRGKRQCQTACSGCNAGCPEYQEEFCMGYEKSPFVCNACGKRLRCRLRRMLYDAKHSQEQYEKMLSESRRGISLTEEELTRINDAISPLIRQGQSIPAICGQYRDALPVTDRTIYTYIDAGLLDARNIDLRRKLRRPERKKNGPVLRVDKKCHIGRTYEDYQAYIAQNLDVMVSQMDSVVIHKGGQARDRYTEEEIREMMNHINSYPRKKWNGQAPIDLFIKVYGEETATLLGLEKIPSASIALTPALFNR